MTVNEKIVKALLPFDIPVRADFFEGSEEEYFTFNPAADYASDFGDDAPGTVVVSVQIHYFLPLNKDYLESKKKIRNALWKSGFTYPDVEVLTEPGDNIRHIIFECEIEDDEELIKNA